MLQYQATKPSAENEPAPQISQNSHTTIDTTSHMQDMHLFKRRASRWSGIGMVDILSLVQYTAAMVMVLRHYCDH
jgi:hypothetical protein